MQYPLKKKMYVNAKILFCTIMQSIVNYKIFKNGKRRRKKGLFDLNFF